MSDAISSIGSAAVTTVGTLAVTGAALKVVGNQAKNMNRSSTRTSKHSSYNVWNGTKHKKSKSMLGF